MLASDRMISSMLVALGVACGGMAERTTEATGGMSGAGGSAAGMIHSVVVPGGTAAGGGSSSGGVDGIAGEISMDCDHGAVREYYEGGAPLEPSVGFIGTFDGTALELEAVLSEENLGDPGIYGHVGRCNAYIQTFVALRFAAPYEGDTFLIDVSRGDSCEISAVYQPLDAPEDASDIEADIELRLRSWLPGDIGDRFLMVGDFSARVPAPAEHEINGKFTIEGGFWRCLL